MNIDILFIHTNSSDIVYQELSKNHSAIEPPIWAGLLANSCRSKGHTVQILDCEVLRLNWVKSAETINELNPKLACFVVYGQQPSASTQNMSGAIETAKHLKVLNPNIKTIFVGAHISALPLEVLGEDCVDMVCLNEGVYTLHNLLQTNLSNDQIKKVNGLGYKIDKIPILTEPEQIVPKARLHIDLPGIAWDLLPDLKLYRTAPWHSWSNNSEQAPFAALYTSLGCPYKCSFCMINIINRTNNASHITAEYSNVFRWWDPEFIIKQFDYFAKQGIRNIKIADELFVLNPRHFITLCNLIIERGYNFNMWAYSRVDTCKPEYLDILSKAGIKWLGLGIENPDQLLRQEIHKDSFVEVKITDLIKYIHEAGINVGGNYIFGLPMDTHDSMKNTLDFALSNKTEMVNFYCAMAYPGSNLHMQAKEFGWKLPDTYSGYSQHSYHTQNLPNENLTAKDILQFRDNAFITYNSSSEYLSLLEKKFGLHARQSMENILQIKLKRKLLGD